VQVGEVIDEEGRPEVEDLIPEVREIERRRRLRAKRGLIALLAAVLVVAAAVLGGFMASGSGQPIATTGSGGVAGAIGPTASQLASSSDQGGLNVLLSSLSCSSAESCWAVGETTVPDGQALPMNGTLVEHWDGSAWRPALATGTDVTDSNVTQLAGLSCPDSNWCMTYGSADQHNRGAYAAILSGLQLHQVDLPLPGNVTGVWCESSSSCIAVGVPGGGGFMADRWNGSSWSQMPTSGHLGEPSALSCVTSSFCMAAGSGAGTSGWRPTATVWNGSSWQATPTVRGNFGHGCEGGACSTLVVQQPRFNDVACSTPDFCVALGSAYESFAFEWNGTSWTEQNQLLGSGITSVSCASSADCLATGTTSLSGTSAASRLTALRLSSTGNQDVSPRATRTLQRGGFGPVNCFAALNCMTVGWDWTLQSIAFAGLWNGAKWHSAPFAVPTKQLVQPDALTPTQGPCVGDPTAPSVSVRFVARSTRHGNTIHDFSHAYPQCQIVGKGQAVSVVNDTGAPALVTIGTAYVASLGAGATLTLKPSLSDRLAPGVFELSLQDSSIGSAGFGAGLLADLWVEPQCANPATGTHCSTLPKTP
jgi:hypothetical protein